MVESAQVVLTGYDKSKIAKSVKTLKNHFKKINVKIVEEDTRIKPKSKLWGCEKDNLVEEVLFLSGTMDDLRKILHINTEDGVYLQLLK